MIIRKAYLYITISLIIYYPNYEILFTLHKAEAKNTAHTAKCERHDYESSLACAICGYH